MYVEAVPDDEEPLEEGDEVVAVVLWAVVLWAVARWAVAVWAAMSAMAAPAIRDPPAIATVTARARLRDRRGW